MKKCSARARRTNKMGWKKKKKEEKPETPPEFSDEELGLPPVPEAPGKKEKKEPTAKKEMSKESVKEIITCLGEREDYQLYVKMSNGMAVAQIIEELQQAYPEGDEETKLPE